MTEEIAQLVKELYAAGEVGLVITLILLTAIILTIGVVLYLQRQSLKQIQTISEATDSQIKLLDAKFQSTNSQINLTNSLREESKVTVDFVKDQLNVVTTTNEELRKELSRIRDEQKKMSIKQSQLTNSQAQLKTAVSESITVGLEDIKLRINEVTVQEILNQVPRQFRDDMEKQLAISSEAIINHIIESLKDTSSEFIDDKAIEVIADKIVSPILLRVERTIFDSARNIDYLSHRFERLLDALERNSHIRY